jgi:tRNA uridine 5-carbamoylmethylation protein Kti12
MNINVFNSLDVILICGLPGAGKSHFSKTYLSKNDRKHINRKEIRQFIYEMTTFGDKWYESYYNVKNENIIKHVEKKLYEHLLSQNYKVLVDNTSMNKSSRKKYVDIARHLNKTIGTIFLNTSLEKCILRNQELEDCIPGTVVTNLYASREMPENDEGFKEILILDNY